MTITHDAQARARAAVAALGLAPWAGADHAVYLRRALVNMKICSYAAYRLRASSGLHYHVTRHEADLYEVVRPGEGGRKMGADEAVALMEVETR